MKFNILKLKFYFLSLILILCSNKITIAQNEDSIKQLPLFIVESQKVRESNPIFYINLKEQNIIKNDISEIIKTIPNISAIRRGGTALDPVMRGFRNNQILILFDDGAKIEGGCPNRMDPVTSHIPIEEVDNIEILQGSSMLAYGPAVGGTILIKSKFPEFSEKKSYELNFSSLYQNNPLGASNYLSANYSNKKILYRIAFGYSKYDDYKNGNSEIFKTSFEKYNASLKSAIKINENQILKLQVLGSFARDVMFPALPMDEKKDNTYLLNFSYSLKLNDKKSLKISSYYSNVEHLMDNSFRPQFKEIVPPLTGIMQAFSNVDAINTGGNITYFFYWNKIKFKSNTELEYIYKDGIRKRNMIMNMSGITTTSIKYDNLWFEAKIINSATSLSISKELFKNNSIEGIIRFDNFLNYSSDTFSLKQSDKLLFDKKNNTNNLFSFGFKYSLSTDNFSLSAGISRSMRNANMNELYIKRLVIGFDNYDYLGNPFLKPEINNQTDISVKFGNKNYKIQLNSFYAYVENYIGGVLLPSTIISPATQGVWGVKQFQNLGESIFVGGELSVSYNPFNSMILNISSGYTYAIIKKTEKYLIENQQVVGKTIVINDPLPEIPQLSISSSLQFLFNNNLSRFELKANYLMLQKNVSEANYEKTTPSSLTMDFELQHSLKRFVIIKTGVRNVFNTNYYEHLNRRIVGSDNYLYEPGRCIFVQINFSFNSLKNE